MVGQLLLPGHVEKIAGFAAFRGVSEYTSKPLRTNRRQRRGRAERKFDGDAECGIVQSIFSPATRRDTVRNREILVAATVS